MRKIIILTIGLSLIIIPGLLTIAILISLVCPRVRRIAVEAIRECRDDFKHIYAKLINSKVVVSLIIISAYLH
jgi:UPF0716 family protein affecting phage T7 exclusion